LKKKLSNLTAVCINQSLYFFNLKFVNYCHLVTYPHIWWASSHMRKQHEG